MSGRIRVALFVLVLLAAGWRAAGWPPWRSAGAGAAGVRFAAYVAHSGGDFMFARRSCRHSLFPS